MIMSIRIRKSILLVLIALSTGASTASAEKSFDPCVLLTRAEVEAEFGGAVQKTEGGESRTGGKFCNWHGPKQSAVRHKAFSLIVALDNGASRFNAFKATIRNGKEEPGIGTAAYSTPQGGLVLYNDNIFLQVTPLYGGKDHTVEMSKRLASKALEKLR